MPTTVEVGRAIGRNTNVVWRWLEVLGHPHPGRGGQDAHPITDRDALAVYVGHLHGRTPLGRLIAQTIARTHYPWLFVRLGCVLGADTASELLRLWRQVDTPPGVILNLERLADESHLQARTKGVPT